MKSPEEQFEKLIYHPMFMKTIGLDYQLAKSSFFFYFYRYLKLFLFGAVAPALYDYPIPQVAVITGIEVIYFVGLSLVRPYISYLKMLVNFVLHLILVGMLCLTLVIHPEIKLVNFSAFDTIGKVLAVVMFVLLCYVSLMILFEVGIAIHAAYKHAKDKLKKNAVPKAPKEEKVSYFLILERRKSTTKGG